MLVRRAGAPEEADSREKKGKTGEDEPVISSLFVHEGGREQLCPSACAVPAQWTCVFGQGRAGEKVCNKPSLLLLWGWESQVGQTIGQTSRHPEILKRKDTEGGQEAPSIEQLLRYAVL